MLPSIIFAMVFIVPMLYLLTSIMGLDKAPIIPSVGAVIYAIILGLFIPTASSIVPVKKSLN